jgi:hypothetical protein
MYYHSETVRLSSMPLNGKVHGTRNVVTIKNGKGTKIKTALNKSGKPIKTRKVKLNAGEIKKITDGTFLPGFWKNCALGMCTKTRSLKRN